MVKVRNLPQDSRDLTSRAEYLLEITRKAIDELYPGEFSSTLFNGDENQHNYNRAVSTQDSIRIKSTSKFDKDIKVFTRSNTILLNHAELFDMTMVLAGRYEQFDRAMSSDGKRGRRLEWTVAQNYEVEVESENI